MGSAVAAELFKARSRRLTYILVTVVAILLAFFYLLLWLRAREGPAPRLRGLVEYQALLSSMAFANVEAYGLQLVRTFGTLVAVIFVGMMTGNEYDWGTAALVLGRGVARLHFIVAKIVVAVLFVLIVVSVGFLVALIASAWLSHAFGLSFGDSGLPRVRAALFAEARTVFVILPFVFIAMLFATIWRSAGQAVGFALGVFFLEGIFTPLLQGATGWVARIPDVLVNVNATAVMRGNGGGAIGFFGGLGEPVGPPAGRAALLLAAYCLVCIALVLWRFRRRDLA